MGLLIAAALVAVAGMVGTYIDAQHSTSLFHFDTFWLSMLLGLASTIGFAVWIGRSRASRLAILTGFGIFTYLPKFLMSINGPVWYDEYGQWRHANDILRTGALMPSSTYLPILRGYPGLGLATDAIHEVTRLSTWHSGQLLILSSHCASLLLVYVIASATGLTDGTAFLAALIFGLNPSFTYFDTEFAYESLGITLALTVLYCMIRLRRATPESPARRLLAFGAVAAAACVVTHHVSTAMMLFWLLCVAVFVPPVRDEEHRPSWIASFGPWLVLAGAATMTAVWFTVAAPQTVSYLLPHFRAAWDQVETIAGIRKAAPGHGAANVLHAPFSGAVASLSNATPSYEHTAGFLAPGIVLLLTAAGVWSLWRRGWEQLRRAMPFVIVAGAYFLSLPAALTNAGGEAAHRSWSFTYLGIAVVGAVGLHAIFRIPHPRLRMVGSIGGVIAVAVLCVGNVAAGENALYRFPGPYVFSATSRARTPEALNLAAWIRSNLPPGVKILSDVQTNEILTGYTDDFTASPTDAVAYAVYRVGPIVSPGLQRALASEGFQYLVLNTQIETTIPPSGFFLGYHSYFLNISPPALKRIADGPVFHLLHTEGQYQVFSIRLPAVQSSSSSR